MKPLVLCLLFFTALPASAQIYRYTDANGNTVFTNQPPSDVSSQEINIQQSNSIQAPAQTNAGVSATSNADSADAQPAYSQLALSGIPNDDASLRANNGDFTVTVQIEPPLASTQSLRLLLDGQPYGKDSSNTRFDLVNINRGEHSLEVAVIDANGNVVQKSAANTFTVQRISTHSPARAR